MKAADKAYFQIKRAILDGRFAPGARITEQEVVDLAGVSRTPVREAFFKLESEGLVVAQAHHGVVVSQLTNDEAEEVFALRAMLEGYCARLAATAITPERLADMREVALRQKAETEKAEPDRDILSGLNAQFHAHLFVACGQTRLKAILIGLIQPLSMRRLFQSYPTASLARSVSDHLLLVDYFEARDAEAAEALARSHVRAAAHDFRQSL